MIGRRKQNVFKTDLIKKIFQLRPDLIPRMGPGPNLSRREEGKGGEEEAVADAPQAKWSQLNPQ